MAPRLQGAAITDYLNTFLMEVSKELISEVLNKYPNTALGIALIIGSQSREG